MNKKIIYIICLVVAIGLVVALVFGLNSATEKRDSNANNLGGKSTVNTTTANTQAKGNSTTNTQAKESTNTISEDTTPKKPTKVTRLDDGTLYSISDQEINPDIVIGDNLFDTQLSDINLNFSQYEGKTVEIEGFYLENKPEANLCYTFVGRYSTANLCQYCPQGYSYFEYEWHGDKLPNLENEKGWLKIKGTFTKGNDETGEYYYIDAQSIEMMDVRGLLTVNN